MDKEKLFELVRGARKHGTMAGFPELAEAHDKLGQATRRTYQRYARQRVSLDDGFPGALLDGVTRESWRPVRAGLLSHLADAWRTALRQCSQAQKSGDWQAAQKAVTIALRALKAAQLVEKAEAPAERSGPKRSKRRSLARLPRDFRERACAAATEQQRPGLAVLWATGCRPAELEHGVRVQLRDGCLSVRIQGAKVTEVTGHEWRELYLDQDSGAGRALLELLGDRKAIHVQRGAKRLGKDIEAIRGKLGLRGLSAYSFRHQTSADAKSAGMTTEEIAQALGHVSTRTQKAYGTARQSRGGGCAVTLAEASRPVRVYERPSAGQPALDALSP